jgi:hypothetical protein
MGVAPGLEAVALTASRYSVAAMRRNLQGLYVRILDSLPLAGGFREGLVAGVPLSRDP